LTTLTVSPMKMYCC